MISSPGKGRYRHDTANGRRSCRRGVWIALGVTLLLAAALLAFIGYQQPELLLDYVNLRYCG